MLAGVLAHILCGEVHICSFSKRQVQDMHPALIRTLMLSFQWVLVLQVGKSSSGAESIDLRLI